MTRLRLEPWPTRTRDHHQPLTLRHLAAALLRRTAAVLARLSRRLALQASRTAPAREPARLEFHAEAGAPEGALYLDGQLVGWLPGVRRL